MSGTSAGAIGVSVSSPESSAISKIPLKCGEGGSSVDQRVDLVAVAIGASVGPQE